MFIYPTLTTNHINLPIRSGQSIIVKSYGVEETTVQLQGDSYQVPLPFIQLATLFNNTQTFGPFETDRTIRIQNRNATVEYDVGFQPALASSTSSLSLTDAQLRAAPLNTNAPATVSKIEELRLQLVTLLGNTDQIETLQQNGINLLTLTNQYTDNVEALLTTLGGNTDTLEALIGTMTGHVDALEPLLTDLKTLAAADATKQDAHTTALNSLIGHVDTLEALTTDLKTRATADAVIQNEHTLALNAINAKLPVLGQATMAASTPVTLASDQAALPVTSPTLLAKLEEIRVIDVADATKQDAHTTALNAINGKMPTLGQKPMADSQPVVLAIDQAAIPVTSPTLLAKEEEIRVELAALNTKQPTIGQKTAVASVPVVLASDQPAIPVTSPTLLAKLEEMRVIEAAISAKLPATIGQKAMAASLAVTLASDQSAIPVTSPTLLAKEEEIRVQVAALNTKAPTLGQKTMAASQPVTLASDQPAITVAYAPVTRTPTLQNVTAAGTVAAGAVMVSILNTGTTAATVAGGQLLPGASITWSPPKGETLAAIGYTATATATLAISRLA